MVPAPKLIVTKFEFTRQYKRCVRKLDAHTNSELATFYGELKTGKIPPGRDLKQIKGTKKNKQKVWQARLNQNYRIRFNFKKGVARLLLVGPHKLFK